MTTTDVPVDSTSVGGGAVAGVTAYVLGYLVTFLLHRSNVEEVTEIVNAIADVFGGDTVSTWEGIGWLFYNGHLVDTMVDGPFGGEQAVDFINSADGASFTALYAVPILLLIVAGAALVLVAGVESPLDGAITGMLTVLGYFPLAVAGVFVFAYSAGDVSMQPDLITGVLLAGVVYPLLFGGIGGVLGSAVQST